MLLINIDTGEEIDGIIERINQNELKSLTASKNFTFDWSYEIENKVYQIKQKGKKNILGLMSLIDFPSELRIHLNLIESNIHQRGKTKNIGNIPACLIAYACREAFKKGYGGFVSLTPKTQLIPYYEKYGFVGVGTQMAVWDEASRLLIAKYLKNEKI